MIKNQQITLNQILVRNEGNIVSDMGGEKVMLSVNNGKYYNLGEIGGQIWDLIERPITVTEIVQLLINKYDVEQVDCVNHVTSFVEHLLEEGLIRLEK
jgi:hypothetical protein